MGPPWFCSYLLCPTAAAADAAAAAAKWSWPTMGCAAGCMAGCGGHPASVLRASPPGPGPVVMGFMLPNIILSLLLSRILFLSS